MTDSRSFPMRPSPHDPRDHVLEEIVRNVRSVKAGGVVGSGVELPKKCDLRPMMTIPRNQGRRGTCAAFSASAIKEYQERIDVNYQEYMSPESIYFYRENKADGDSGMYGRDVMHILQSRGISPEFCFPYLLIEPTDIPTEAEQTMEKFKIKEYAQVLTIDGVKQALIYCGPLLICFPIYKNSPEFWKPSGPDDAQRGGHAVVIVGYNETGFIIRNSWGSTWNGDGCVIFPYTDFGIQWEIWSSVDEKTIDLLPEFLKPRNKLLDLITSILNKFKCTK